MIQLGNATASELFRLNGTLPQDHIERLLELEEVVGHASGMVTHIDEAAAQFPNEDFLGEVIDELHELAKGMRGLNRAKLNALATKLDEIQLDAGRSAEYGRDELRKAKSLAESLDR